MKFETDVLKHHNRKRLCLIGLSVMLACFVLITAYTLANDLPGGFSDQRRSHITGLKSTIRIPLGKTPVDAVQKFRHFPTMQIVYKEVVKDGELIFIKRFYQKEGTDLQIEFVRKTWFGWKWVWGGGFGIANLSATIGLDYAVMPKINGIYTPFPMVYGELFNPSISKIMIITNGQNPGVFSAQLKGSNNENKMIWFAFLPESVTTPFEIEAHNAKGDIVARKKVYDLNGYGEIEIGGP
ncbi:hypothetical protein ACFFSY_18925 [Paenibacillus aurantiacus]|uniref:Uncharacterized protein n=1 Tax=Paenibacillus aurantiacus TaxID=1936118 RepID=A0ABV5KS09_9BACL